MEADYQSGHLSNKSQGDKSTSSCASSHRHGGVSAMLMQINQANELYGLAMDNSPAARVRLASSISKILNMEVTDRESEMVADVLVELLRQAEKDVRMAVSEQLASMDGVPLRLILQLANDEVDIATPVLQRSSVLGDMDLIYIIKAKSAEYWRVIATRKNMGDCVVDALAETNDYETALNLTENMSIHITEKAALLISDMAQKHQDLAIPLLRRDDINNEVAMRLYEYVGQEIKQYILQNYDIDTQKIIDTVDNTVKEFRDSQENNGFKPEEHMIKAARSIKEKGKLNIKLMLATLRRGQFRSFVAQFVVFTELDIQTVGNILMQSHGQGLAIACKAFGISKEDFVSMFLLTNKFRNDGRMVDAKEISKAVSYYSRVEKDVAMSIIRNSADSK